MAKRIDRISELIKEVVSAIILRGVQFPEGAMVTVTRAVVSPDLHYANVFVTVFSSQSGKEDEAMLALKKNTPKIQHELNRKLRMRPVPRIQFLIDEEEGRRERVEKLLQEDGAGGI